MLSPAERIAYEGQQHVTIPSGIYTLPSDFAEAVNSIEWLTGNEDLEVLEAGCLKDLNLEIASLHSTKVNQIPPHCFQNCQRLSTVILPDCLEEIGDYAFANCKSLISLRIPRDTKVIGDYAFVNCKSLGNMYIPSYVKTISDTAFESCPRMVMVCEVFSAAYKYAENHRMDMSLVDKNGNPSRVLL